MFQLCKDIFSLVSVPRIEQVENWHEDIACQLRDLVRTDRMVNSYVVWYRDDVPYFIFVVAPVEDRHYVYVKHHLDAVTARHLRATLSQEVPPDKYFLCADAGVPKEIEGVTFHGVALNIPESVTDDVIMQFIGSAGMEVIRHRKNFAPGYSPVLFLMGTFTEEDINELEQCGFKLGNLLYKF